MTNAPIDQQLRSYINPRVADQIPPIGDFERWLVQLSVAGPQPLFWQSNKQQPRAFVLELVAGVREHVVQHLANNRAAIVEKLSHCLADESPETMQR